MGIGRFIYKSLGLIFPILYLYFNKIFVLILILIILACFILIDKLRMSNKKVNRFLLKKFHFVFKEKERKSPMTARWSLLGSFLAILFFSKEIAIVSIFMFVIGDAAGNIFGKKFRKIRMYDKSLEGHFFVFIFSFFVGFLIGNFLGLGLFKIFIGALATTFIQALPIKIDDNLTMPLAAGIAMSLL